MVMKSLSSRSFYYYNLNDCLLIRLYVIVCVIIVLLTSISGSFDYFSSNDDNSVSYNVRM